MAWLQTAGDVKKWVISAFVTSQQVKEVTANGHKKLNRRMIAQTSKLLSAKINKIG